MSKQKTIRNHFIVFLLIANSGLPFFTNEPLILLGSLFFTLFYINPDNLTKRNTLIVTLCFLFVLSIGQWISTSVFDLRTMSTLFVRWTYPFVVLLVVSNQFPRLFVNVIYFLTVVSFVFFIPSMIFPDFELFLMEVASVFEQQSKSSFYSYNSNLLIYTIKPGIAYESFAIFKRNSGPFWEPGGFGSYLIIALLFNLIMEKKIFSRKNSIFMIAIITTWSTAAFAALLSLLFLYGVFILKQTNYKFLMIPLILLISFNAYLELPFIQNRIDRTITYFIQRDMVEYQYLRRDRMISAIVDFQTFLENPIFGTGRYSEVRYGGSIDPGLAHRNNGITDFLVKYGAFFFVFYFWRMRKGFENFAQFFIDKPKVFANISLVAIALVGFSQTLFQQSVFIALFYFFAFSRSRIFTNESNK